MQSSFFPFKAAEVAARRLGTPSGPPRGPPAPCCGGEGGRAAAGGGRSLAGCLRIQGAGAELIPIPEHPLGSLRGIGPPCPARDSGGRGHGAGGAVPSRAILLHSRVPLPLPLSQQTQPLGPRAPHRSPPTQPHRAPAEPQTSPSRWSRGTGGGEGRGGGAGWGIPRFLLPVLSSRCGAGGNRCLFPREAQSQDAPSLGRRVLRVLRVLRGHLRRWVTPPPRSIGAVGPQWALPPPAVPPPAPS